MSTVEAVKSASLWFKDGSSDKVYNCTLEVDTSGYVVNFQYGRRGSALTSGTKTISPVDRAKAERIFDKLVAEKTGKGYQFVGSCGGITTVQQGKIMDGPVILLTPTDEEGALRFMNNPDFLVQQKMDGVRFFLEWKDNTFTAYNRKRREVPIPPKLMADLRMASLPGECEFLIDGELVGDTYHAFDLVYVYAIKDPEKSLLNVGMNNTFIERFHALKQLFFDDATAPFKEMDHITYVPCLDVARDAKEQLRLMEESGMEGVVFKLKREKVVHGTLGDYYKFKFYNTTTCLVTQVNDQRSVGLSMKQNDVVMDFVGNVTIPSNHEVPQVGDIVEVRYLYYFRGGSLYQPVYLGKRSDLEKSDVNYILTLKEKPKDY